MAQVTRGGGSSSKKPSKKAVSSNGDDSYIVFSDAKDDPKDKRVKTGTKPAQGKGGRRGPPPREDAPKKLDKRALIAGGSWTGKLPVNLLSEHCQRQHWEKPEYTMAKTSEGFLSTVILRTVHPKTKETTILPALVLPQSHKHLAVQPSAVEARHFAATYALFRVSSMKNVHMMLPPNYRDFWKGEFQALKMNDVKSGNAWMYEADPFTAIREKEGTQALMAKNENKTRRQIEQKEKQPSYPNLGNNSGPGNSRNALQGWNNVPTVDMGKRMRFHVEELLRRHVTWNPHAVSMPSVYQEILVKELNALGFRRIHVEEAALQCKDRQETLEWLLVHVPEDDLPQWCLPEDYVTGISMASNDIKRESSLKRLAGAGYSPEICKRLLDENKGHEMNTAEALQNLLVRDLDLENSISELVVASEKDESTWSEEMEMLASIYGERYQGISDSTCKIRLEIQDLKDGCILNVQKSKSYPSSVPILGLSGNGIPAYVRLSIYRQVIKHVYSIPLLWTPMVFSMIDWLEEHIPRIMDQPGKLRDVAAAVTIITEAPTGNRRSMHTTKKQPRPRKLAKAFDPESIAILRLWEERQKTSAQSRLMALRQSLPAWAFREVLVKTVTENQVTIISGETGSGKSTQSVQFVLDDMIQMGLGSSANIICTQPRRISAISLADRVSAERCSITGEEVGYVIRGESKSNRAKTRITFMTTGVLLRRLQISNSTQTDIVAALAEVSHVVVDEVHERSLDTDFLLVLLRKVLEVRDDLKVILMSATLDANVFEAYFQGRSSVGKIELPGRKFKIDDFYLDDVIQRTSFALPNNVSPEIQGLSAQIHYDLIVATVAYLELELGDSDGGILIFLPGVAEINRTLDALESLSNLYALPLHASLTPAEQRLIFLPPPNSKRKVIACTNVAETSLTVPDIVAVIDTGKVKETSFDPQNNMIRLEEVWASRAACKQRQGRAGRVRAGMCYKLYTRNTEAKMPERPEPEIRRVSLEQLCLSVYAMGIKDVSGFLANAPAPPDVSAVEGALEILRRMNVLDGDELTALGRQISMIPADLRCGKLMVYGIVFCCLEACLIISAILTVKSPFISHRMKRDESKAARLTFSNGQGDLIADYRAFSQWSQLRASSTNREVRTWCEKNFLSYQILNDISSNRAQYLLSLREAGFLPMSYQSHNPALSRLNAHNSNFALLRALISGAFSPQIARIAFPDKKYAASVSGAIELDPEAKTIKYFTRAVDAGRVFIHPGSTLFGAQGFPGNSTYMAYFSRIATTKIFMRELTPFNTYALLMFSGPVLLDTMGRGLVVDGWLRLRGWARIGALVGRLRIILDRVLEGRMEQPEGTDDPANAMEEEVVEVVRKLVEFDGMDG